MKPGLLEQVLTRRYGQPVTSIRDGMGARLWNTEHPDDEAVLYIGMKWLRPSETRFSPLREIYGDSCGGYLIKNTLKAAILLPQKIYGIWNIDDLGMRPEIQCAIAMDLTFRAVRCAGWGIFPSMVIGRVRVGVCRCLLCVFWIEV